MWHSLLESFSSIRTIFLCLDTFSPKIITFFFGVITKFDLRVRFAFLSHWTFFPFCYDIVVGLFGDANVLQMQFWCTFGVFMSQHRYLLRKPFFLSISRYHQALGFVIHQNVWMKTSHLCCGISKNSLNTFSAHIHGFIKIIKRPQFLIGIFRFFSLLLFSGEQVIPLKGHGTLSFIYFFIFQSSQYHSGQLDVAF